MNVLILGTSNSLLRDGWVDGLINAGHQVDNLSVGASPSIQFLDTLATNENIEFSRYDIVFIDAVINDEAYFPKFIGQKRYLQVYFDELVKQISCQAPVVVIEFARRRCFKEQSWASLIHESVAHNYSQKFISLRRILHDVFKLSDKNFDDLYCDNIHFRPEVAYIFGFALGRSLNKIIPKISGKVMKKFIVLTENLQSKQYKQTRFKNSKFSIEATTIDSKEKLLSDVSTGEAIAGFKIVSSHTNCFLKLDIKGGDSRFVLLNYTLPKKNKFLIKYVPLKPFMEVRKISVVNNLPQVLNGEVIRGLHSEPMTKGVFNVITYTKLIMVNDFRPLRTPKFEMTTAFPINVDETMVADNMRAYLQDLRFKV